jgi:23S rRNA pseudouridine2605 synthase
LAAAGIGSRRQIESWIRDGRIRVNGTVATLGDRVGSRDRVSIDGRPLPVRLLAAAQRHVIMYNKPEGEIVSRADPAGRELVFQQLPRLAGGRWIAVGRLDANTTGLLLCTTDGELANRLMHPAGELEREYLVRVLGEVTPEIERQLVSGVELEDGPARFRSVQALRPRNDQQEPAEVANRWYRVVLQEGRKREVRRLWEAVGCRVSRLKRIRFGPIALDAKVRVGYWRPLTPAERQELLQAAGLTDAGDWQELVLQPRDPARKRLAPQPGRGAQRRRG